MIQGINNNQSDLYSVYNRIQQRRLNQEDILGQVAGQSQDPEHKSAAQEVQPAREMDLRLDAIKPRQNASLEDVSLSLTESSAAFEMKGRESDINSLDIQKAVSDMQKDQALMQYQYFVGDSNPFVQSEDGIVIQK